MGNLRKDMATIGCMPWFFLGMGSAFAAFYFLKLYAPWMPAFEYVIILVMAWTLIHIVVAAYILRGWSDGEGCCRMSYGINPRRPIA